MHEIIQLMPAPRGVLTADQRYQLSCLTRDRSVNAVLALRARLVLWWDEGHSAVQIAEWAGVADKTARLWPVRYAESGIEGLRGIPHPGKPRAHDERVRARILALSRTSPPEHTGLSHWSSREMAKHLKRHESIRVSHVFVADLWREHRLKPHRQDTFNSRGTPTLPRRALAS
jgi:transposase